MLTLPGAPRHVQAFYSTTTGMLIREDGRTWPATLDHLETFYGRDMLDEVIGNAGQWVTLAKLPPAVVTANVAGKVYTVDIAPALAPVGSFVVDADNSTIHLAVAGAPALVDALNRAAEQGQPVVTTTRCRCWTYRRNCDKATIIVPGVGKLEALLVDIGADLFNKIAEAEAAAWKLPLSDAARGKGYVDLIPAEVEAFKAKAPVLGLITRPIAKFTPPDRPAA
jgi:hypothetical protein